MFRGIKYYRIRHYIFSHGGLILEETSKKAFQSPLLLSRTAETYTPIGYEEAIAITFYYAEDNRRKPGFLRRTGERITLVAPINYALYIVDIDGRNSIIIDPNKGSELVITYYKPITSLIEEKIYKLRAAESKEFIDILTELKQVLQGMTNDKSGVEKYSIRISNIVKDRTLIEELKILVRNASENIYEALRIEEKKIDLLETKKNIREALILLSDTRKKLVKLLGEINPIHEKWLEEIRTSYAEKIHEIEQKLEEVKKEVDERINELKKKQAEEIKSIREKYIGQIETLERRINEINAKLEQLKAQYEKAKEYGEDTKMIKKRINDLSKKLSDLIKEKKELEEKMNSEIEAVRSKYLEYINAERMRIDKLKKEIEKLNNELDSIEKQAGDRIDEIRALINQLIDKASKVENGIVSIMINTPPHGEGLHYLPVIIITYRSKNKSRRDSFTPAYISTGKLSRTPKISFFEEVRKYLSDIPGILSDARYADQVEKYNLLKTVNPTRIISLLDRLADNGIINRKKVQKIAEKIVEQIKMVQA